MALFGNSQRNERGEMSFVDHLDALRKHLMRALVAIVLGMIVSGIYNEFIIDQIVLGPVHKDFISFRKICEWGQQLGLGDRMCIGNISVNMQNTATTGQVSLFFVVLFIGGFVLAFPYVFWEFWRFIRPALTEKELKRTRGVIFWVSFLFFLGILFGYFFLVPFSMNFLASFSLSPTIQNIWTIKSYINTIMPLVLGTGLSFQLPLVLFFMAQIGLVTSSFLKKNRKYAIVVILVLAAVITPPDVISQVIVTIPLMGLYEVGLVLVKGVERNLAKKEVTEWS